MDKIIIFLYLSLLLSGPFVPSNGETINYTQLFFKWPQIIGADAYEFKIYEYDIVHVDTIQSNSILVSDLLSWDTSYSWQVCGINDYADSCLMQNTFTINSLPEYHPDEISILHLNENYYQNGINILDFESLGYSLAINKYGDAIWFADQSNFEDSKIISGELLENGNFTGFSNGAGYEFTINSDIIFQTPNEYNVHHQISKSHSNTYFIIDAEVEYHPCPIECDSTFSMFPIPWQGDRYIELNQLGQVIWEWNTFDEIILSEYNPYYAETYNGTIEFDWTHSNSILYDSLSQSVYVSIRNLSRITSIDYSTGEINWNLGNPEYMENPDFQNEIGFSQQHSAQLTEDGNLIFFDNGRYQDPEISRCVEVGFDNEEEPFVVWEHILPDSMFTGSRGECDRLVNGNTLISAGRTGNVIEVSNDNELIWHLRAMDNHGNDISIYRTQRAPDIFPNIFSFIINNLEGQYSSYFIINNGNVNISIFNQGWMQTDYIYYLLNNTEEILIEDIITTNSNIINYDIDISAYGLPSDILYTLRLCSINNLDNCQDINFQFETLLDGDVNSDGEINIFDVIITVNYILLDEFNSYADFNGDDIINIQDIILLLDLIL